MIARLAGGIHTALENKNRPWLRCTSMYERLRIAFAEISLKPPLAPAANFFSRDQPDRC